MNAPNQHQHVNEVNNLKNMYQVRLREHPNMLTTELLLNTLNIVTYCSMEKILIHLSKSIKKNES